MELIENLFMGYPNLWGGGVAHSVLILSLVITLGIALGKIKVAGVSLGVTWILFVGIVFGHFNMNLNEHLLHFLKEFGLILFVYSIGLQVGPGFFSAFKKGGFTLNVVAMIVVFTGVDGNRPAFCYRNADHYNGRYPFGSCNQYAGTWCGTAGKQ
jgi:putative transport protein